MKHLRVRAKVDPEQAPTFFNQLANSPHVREARVLDWNGAVEDASTTLIAIDGDPDPFAESATATPGIESVELAETRYEQTYALVVARPRATPMFDAITEARARPGVVFRKPIVYRDSTILCRVVGDPGPLQSAVEAAPDAMETQIEEIETIRGDLEQPASRLSERQREAVDVALDLGYFDYPRGATHEDVARELGCAAQTVSEHLQKAEGKVIRASMDEFGPRL